MQVLTLVVLVDCAATAVLSADTYTTQFDNIDLEAILKNEKLVDNYTKCLMDEGPCTNEGRTLKKLLPDALKTACAKCTEKQKTGARKVIKFYQTQHPEDFKKLQQKYDPEGKFKAEFEKALFGQTL
uniref:Chemosensory protein 1 n=1 Tax=Bemisia tabaci TaxID=7038 RepID=A0A097GUD1_BEMTA|nr:chemosensory protein 1 [Bemisia tabaci]